MDLKDHFREKYGEDKVIFSSISVDMDTGVSKGCGLVQLATPEDVELAIEEMDGSTLKGNEITVRKDIQERLGRGKGSGSAQEDKRKSGSRYKDKPERPERPAFVEKPKVTASAPLPQEPLEPYDPTKPYDRKISKDEKQLSDNTSYTKIQEIVDKRNDLRNNKQFEEADAMRSKLRVDFFVQIDDKTRQWRVLSNTKKDGTERKY